MAKKTRPLRKKQKAARKPKAKNRRVRQRKAETDLPPIQLPPPESEIQ